MIEEIRGLLLLAALPLGRMAWPPEQIEMQIQAWRRGIRWLPAPAQGRRARGAGRLPEIGADHHRELQALAGVQGHQGHPVLLGVLAVGSAGQRRGGQEILQRALLVLLLVLQGGIHQLVEVAAAVLGLIGAIGDQLGHVAALLHHPLHHLGWRRVL